jgi:hypothetical protein
MTTARTERRPPAAGSHISPPDSEGELGRAAREPSGSEDPPQGACDTSATNFDADASDGWQAAKIPWGARRDCAEEAGAMADTPGRGRTGWRSLHFRGQRPEPSSAAHADAHPGTRRSLRSPQVVPACPLSATHRAPRQHAVFQEAVGNFCDCDLGGTGKAHRYPVPVSSRPRRLSSGWRAEPVSGLRRKRAPRASDVR